MATLGPYTFSGSDFSSNFTADTGSFNETGGQLQSTGSSWNSARHTSGALSTNDQDVQAEIAGSASGNVGGLSARQASATLTYYAIHWVDTANGRIREIISGSSSNLLTVTAATITTTKTLKIRVVGTSITYFEDGVSLGSTTSSSISSGTYAGVSIFGTAGRWNDWTAQDYSSAINLVIAEALHAHSADNIAITQTHVITIAEALHAHSADNIAITQTHILTVADALHAHSADNVTIDQGIILAIADALHAHSADNIAITQAHVITIAEALHAHSADNVTISLGGITLAIAEALHAHSADALVLTQTHILTIAEALHALSSDNLNLSEIEYSKGLILVIEPSRHILTIEPGKHTLVIH